MASGMEFSAHLLFFLGVLAAAATFALVEIHAEGSAGWAANLPTWRLRSAWLGWLFPGRPLTGYHLWMMLFTIVVAHLPFTFGLRWSWPHELRSLAFMLFFWVIEDFLWFALNPHYGLRRFRPQFIPWHKKAWWWLAPRDYWIGLALAITLYASSLSAAPAQTLALAR